MGWGGGFGVRRVSLGGCHSGGGGAAGGQGCSQGVGWWWGRQLCSKGDGCSVGRELWKPTRPRGCGTVPPLSLRTALTVDDDAQQEGDEEEENGAHQSHAEPGEPAVRTVLPARLHPELPAWGGRGEWAEQGAAMSPALCHPLSPALRPQGASSSPRIPTPPQGAPHGWAPGGPTDTGACTNPMRVPRASWGDVAPTPSSSGGCSAGGTARGSSPSKTGLQNSVCTKATVRGTVGGCTVETHRVAPPPQPYLAALHSLGAKHDFGEVLHGSSTAGTEHLKAPPERSAPRHGRVSLHPLLSGCPHRIRCWLCPHVLSPTEPYGCVWGALGGPAPLGGPLPSAPLIQLS